jgi:tetratricopeptide (TPR) repeat protein
LHAAAALALYAALARTTGAPWRAATVALLFALHPLHVESVAWVSERKDVLSGLFFMLGVLAYARYVEAPSRGRYALVWLALVAGLASKAIVVTLPVVLLLLDVWPLARWRREGPRRLLLEKLPLFAVAALAALLTLHAQRAAGAMSSAGTLPLGVRVAQAILSSVTYLRQTLWPEGLAVFYPYPSEIELGSVALAALLLAGISVGALRALPRAPWLAVGWGWYLVTLLPVIGLVQVGLQAHADRYTYLPLVGIFVAGVWGVSEPLARSPALRRALVPLALAASAACLVLTRLQTATWRDSTTLFERAVAVTEDNYVAHNHLGLALMGQGRLAEARAHFEEAVRIQPRYPDARNNLAGVLLNQGHLEPAIAELRQLVEYAPHDAAAHRSLAALLRKAGRTDEAAAAVREAERIESGGAR